ncbi:MAG: asparagine synthetase B, partial [Chloroflexi bacterium]
VPVGAYLSGGLDSSATAALAHPLGEGVLNTYGLGFTTEGYDESSWQDKMVDHLDVKHRAVHVDSNDVVNRFRQVPWHAETPMTRAAPGPLMALSSHVHNLDCKVVLTGEGADEVFVGYNIFREAKVRNFWSRVPHSQSRPLLLNRLYPYVEKPPLSFLRRFFGRDLTNTTDPLYSHRPRWHNTTAAGFLVNEARVGTAPGEAEERIVGSLPAEFTTWGPVAKAQYLEMTLFMSGYLLSTQGDRMLMANSVEGRFPFLDHKLVEYAATIPASAKLQSLREKAILRKSVTGLVPDEIVNRSKHPFRAPGNVSFETPSGQAMVEEFLAADGPGWELWQRAKVEALVTKWRAGRLQSTRDDMSFLAVLSGRILQAEFGANFEQRMAQLTLQPNQIIWRQ